MSSPPSLAAHRERTALGELVPPGTLSFPPGLSYCKFGLAGWRNKNWREALNAWSGLFANDSPNCTLVTTAYADWRNADAPPINQVHDDALSRSDSAFLIDTWHKDGSTLLDHLTLLELTKFCDRCRAANARVALAGSLGPLEIKTLKSTHPNWFAVRGTACQGGREGSIDLDAVRALANLIEC